MDQFQIDLKRLEVQLDNIVSPQRLEQITRKACHKIQSEAVKNLKNEQRWNTGTLAASIGINVYNAGYEIIGEVGTPLSYAPYVEYGTGKFVAGGRQDKWAFPNENHHYKDEYGNTPDFLMTEGQPPIHFLNNAFENSLNDIERMFKEGLRNV